LNFIFFHAARAFSIKPVAADLLNSQDFDAVFFVAEFECQSLNNSVNTRSVPDDPIFQYCFMEKKSAARC
jgi:hypothetical protein